MKDRSVLTTTDDGGGFVFRVWVETDVAHCICTQDKHLLSLLFALSTV